MAPSRSVRRAHRFRPGIVACISSAPLLLPALALYVIPSLASAQVAGPGTAYVQEIPGTLVTFEMVPVPGGQLIVRALDGRPLQITASPFWIARTETTWDLYDVFVYSLDRAAPRAQGEDAVSRPSRPYVLPGDAFGHKGLPALGMSLHAAREFAKWVSVRTGRNYRVPTEDQWLLACARGAGPTARAGNQPNAWTAPEADDRTHAVGSKEADRLGLSDMLGNVAEWVVPAADSAVVGGAWDNAAADVGCAARRPQTRAWNETDPQLPKSRWWLTDAPFVGVRLIRIPDDSTTTRGNGP